MKQPDPSPTVPVPRPLLFALVLAAFVGLVAVGFLLGRGSAPEGEGRMPPPASPATPLVADTGAPPPSEEPPAPAALPEPTPSAPPTPEEVRVPEPAPPAAPATRAPERPSPPQAPREEVDPALRREVADYFAAMDRYLKVAAAWNNPDTVTEAVVAQAAQGNPGGLERILSENREALKGIQAIEPPAPCRAHHRLAQEVLVSASRLVAQLGAQALTPMQTTPYDNGPAARNLQRKVQELRQLKAQILAYYQLPADPAPAEDDG